MRTALETAGAVPSCSPAFVQEASTPTPVLSLCCRDYAVQPVVSSRLRVTSIAKSFGCDSAPWWPSPPLAVFCAQKGFFCHPLLYLFGRARFWRFESSNVAPELTGTEFWDAYWVAVRFLCVVFGALLLGDICALGTPFLTAIDRLELAFRLAVFLSF